MVEIQSKEVIDKISDELKVQPSMAIPRELAKDIQLVYNINPDNHEDVLRSTFNTATLFTVPTSQQDFFLTGSFITSSSVNQSASQADTLIITPKGKTPVIINAAYTSTPATGVNTNTSNITLSKPIQLEAGSLITATVGSSASVITITGFLVNKQ